MNIEELVKNILKQQLQLGDRANQLTHDTPLIGAMPEMDSMGVVNIITALEEQTGCAIDDEEISAEIFETLGSLIAFVDSKL